MPRVAKLLPIPRRLDAKGIQRYGFHGLSYAYLMEELARLGDPAASKGSVILAHLGNGASLAAVRDGKSIDTSMGFTPTAGLVMSTRSGDLDPGLAPYLSRTEGLTTKQFYAMVNHESGLLGVSETSSDMRDLLAQEATDVRAAEAVALFCYQAKKWIGAFAVALGGLDTLVFAGGIGENAPTYSSTHLRGFEHYWHRIESGSERQECRCNFIGQQQGQGSRHSHRRRSNDCALGSAFVSRAICSLKDTIAVHFTAGSPNVTLHRNQNANQGHRGAEAVRPVGPTRNSLSWPRVRVSARTRLCRRRPGFAGSSGPHDPY